MKAYRDELIISTKAGYDMWPGPYGNWGSRKYLLASLDQSLKRMGLEYVDIFYSHRPDPETPLEETMGALDQAVRWAKRSMPASRITMPSRPRRRSKFCASWARPASSISRSTPCSSARRSRACSMCWARGRGRASHFAPLAQGLLTDRYLKGIPEDSRAAKPHRFLKPSDIDELD